MVHYLAPCIIGGEMVDVWVFYTIKEAEQHKSNRPNWPSVLSDMKKYLGHKWLDKKDIIYVIDGKPIYKEYRIVGLEDNNAALDYYWIIEDDKRNRKHILANRKDFYENIV